VPIQVTCPTCQGMFNAPDSAAGKKAKCPKCGGVIQIPEPAVEEDIEEEIVDAEADVASPFTDDDFDVEPPAALPAASDRKPCPMCGEMIQKDAVKCRYCGEVFDPVLRAQERKRAAKDDPDADMSVLEWVIAILCSGIGCIVGIIYIIQGKPKGKKMLLVSLCVQLIGGVIQAIIAALAQQQ